MQTILEKISKIGIVPVIKIDDIKTAVPLAKALVEGGLPCAEITFRTAQAPEAIKLMTTQFPDMLVGAGTVLTTEQVDKAIEAGAKFIVSPGINPKIVQYCQLKNILIIPGCITPSEVEIALENGLSTLKFFPAEQAGGLAMIKSMCAPYTNVKFMPTGGVNAKNLNDYLAFPKIVACGGSWMVDPTLVNNGDFDKIRELTAEAVKTMLGFELAHIGINAENEAEAEATAKLFSSLFGFEYKNGNSSIFTGSVIEVMKTPYLGRLGHIAISTNYLDRAISYFEAKGIEFNPDSAKLDDKGNMVALYMKNEIGGFAVHLVQKKRG
ncbi:MAG: bifunctional 4-hydroxy-2-oxoglutarate aldolase/2-dehydro-3-deoxy-phosphogluconate aldolase [Oscillospiraceae bacterium]